MKTVLLLIVGAFILGCYNPSEGSSRCGENKGPCKEEAFSLTRSSWHKCPPGTRIERVGNDYVCRCPGGPVPSTSASAEAP